MLIQLSVCVTCKTSAMRDACPCVVRNSHDCLARAFRICLQCTLRTQQQQLDLHWQNRLNKLFLIAHNEATSVRSPADNVIESFVFQRNEQIPQFHWKVAFQTRSVPGRAGVDVFAGRVGGSRRSLNRRKRLCCMAVVGHGTVEATVVACRLLRGERTKRTVTRVMSVRCFSSC